MKEHVCFVSEMLLKIHFMVSWSLLLWGFQGFEGLRK